MNKESGGQDSGVEDWPLKRLNVFSPEQLQLLNEHAIHTFGELLGATTGLTTVPDFLGGNAVSRQIFKDLANRFPIEIERYRVDPGPFPATGCWIEEEAPEDDGTP